MASEQGAPASTWHWSGTRRFILATVDGRQGERLEGVCGRHLPPAGRSVSLAVLGD